jgi:phage terminase small subunit
MGKHIPATENTPAWAVGLSDKEAAFVLAYMVDLNLKNAGLAAGFAKKTAGAQASQYRRRPHVAEAISKLMQERHGIQGAKIISTLGAIAYVDAADFFEIKNGQLTVKDSSTWSPEMRACISEIWETRDGEGRTIIRLKFHDKVSALTRLGQSIGLYKEKSESIVHHEHELVDPKERIMERLAALKKAREAQATMEVEPPVRRPALPQPEQRPPDIEIPR